jgi:hypothetical protein
VIHHPVESVEVLFALRVQRLGLGLQLLEASFRINVDCIFGNLAQIELGFERLRSLAYCQSLSQWNPATPRPAYSGNALLKPFETHPPLNQ